MKDNKTHSFTNHVGMPLNVVRRRAVNEFNEMVYFEEIKLEIVNQCFCGSSNFELLSRYDRYGFPFGTQICRNCGLISQTINIAEESMEKFYDNSYLSMNLPLFSWIANQQSFHKSKISS